MNLKKVGIIGGAFDPIHAAHLIVGDIFVAKLDLDIAYLVPARISPFKADKKNELVASARHRLQMVKIAAAEHPKFDVETFELERDAVSYSIDTVNYLAEKHPNAEIYLLVGSDQAKKFNRWKNRKAILDKATICIADRPGYLTETDKEVIRYDLEHKEKEPIWLENPLLEISSSDIRQKIKNGESIKYFVPPQVEEYIKRNNLYAV